MSKKTLAFSGIVVILIAFSILFIVFRPAGSKATTYGAPIDTRKGQVVEIASLFSDPAPYLGKNVIMEGRVGQNCQTSGCWLLLTDGGNQLYVQFYDFTVRLNPGTRVRVQGEIRIQNNAPYLVGQGLEVVK